MKFKGILILIGMILSLFLITNISAGIYFSQLDSVYNLGDMIEMNVNVTPEDAGPLRVVLVCDNNTLDVYKGSPTELIQLPLTTLWMNGMTGNCFFKGYYNGEIKDSTYFMISKKLDVTLITNSYFAKPGETINLVGTVKRLNGEPINGEVQISIPLIGASENSSEKISGIVNNGIFSVDYTVRSDVRPGDYRIDISAYEKTAVEKTSEGVFVATIQISQIIKNIDIAIDSQNLEPGKIISFKAVLNDQVDSPVLGDVAIEIRDENSNNIFQKIVKSQERIEYVAQTNMSPGYYDIEATSNSLSKIKRFHVTEKALVSFELVNGTLIIKNIGNIPYNKTIEVKINDEIYFIKPQDFGDAILPGDRREFKLKGNKETNSVVIDDKVSNLTLENVELPIDKKSGVGPTGAAVGISDIIYTPITWIIILLILGAIILFLFRDVFKKKSVTYPAPSKRQFERANSVYNDSSLRVIKLDDKGREINPIERVSRIPKEVVEKKSDPTLNPISRNEKKANVVDYSNKPYSFYKPQLERNDLVRQKEVSIYNDPGIKSQYSKPEILDSSKEKIYAPYVRIIGQRPETTNKAEQVLVTYGESSRAAVIALKIKNTINDFSKDELQKAIEPVYEKKGAVYETGNLIFIIFSPLVTKTFKNEIEAIRVAERITEKLKEYNKKFSDKIEFGIAVNTGEIINKIENKKLKFTSLGTLTITAKKLSELSSGEVLLTKEAYDKAMTEVKADKRIISGTEVYEVKKVADYDKNKKFIKDFLKRDNDVRNRNILSSHTIQPKSSPSWVKQDERKVYSNKNDSDYNTDQPKSIPSWEKEDKKDIYPSSRDIYNDDKIQINSDTNVIEEKDLSQEENEVEKMLNQINRNNPNNNNNNNSSNDNSNINIP